MTYTRPTTMTARPHFPPVPASSSPRYVAMARILQDVIGEAFPPAELLTENRLMEAYRMERQPIREALAVLAQVGIVEQEHRRGVRVSDIGSYEVMDLLNLQASIVETAVDRLIAYPTVEGLSSLRREADATVAAAGNLDADSVVRHTGRFWVTLAEVAGFSLAADMLADNYVKLRVAGWTGAEEAALRTQPERARAAAKDLTALVSYLAKGDKHGALGTAGRCIQHLQVRYADRPRPSGAGARQDGVVAPPAPMPDVAARSDVPGVAGARRRGQSPRPPAR